MSFMFGLGWLCYETKNVVGVCRYLPKSSEHFLRCIMVWKLGFLFRFCLV